MTNRDRGNIKWNALMLPEHVKLLREWQAEDKKIAKPMLDEWQLDEINKKLQFAYEQKLPIRLDFWRDDTYYTITSKLLRFDNITKKLYFSDGEVVRIDELVDVELDVM